MLKRLVRGRAAAQKAHHIAYPQEIPRQHTMKQPLEETDQNLSILQQESLLKTPAPKPPSLWFSKRFLVVIFMFLCYMNTTFIRFNISIAVVEMTSSKKIGDGNSTTTQPPEFDWDSRTVASVLSMFYYGGLVSFMGGYIVSKLGGATSCALCLMLSGITTVLHPITLRYNFYLFMAIRFLTGVFENFLIISVSEVSSKWILKNERSKLTSYSVSGLRVGMAIVHGFCGYLAHGWGWPMIFYATGAFSLITSVCCFIAMKNQPSEDKWISEAELKYIESQQENITTSSRKNVKHPYRNMLSSAAIWALFVVRFSHMWVVTIVVTFLPLYYNDTTVESIEKIGIFSSVPNAASIFVIPICGVLLDYSRKIHIPVTLMHKMVIGGSFAICSALFLSSVIVSDFILSIIAFSLIQMFLGIIILITQIIIISVAPNSSGAVAGLVTFVSSISNILAREMTGYMTTNRNMEEWNNCFILSSVILMLSAVIFAFYGSSEPQSWSKLPSPDDLAHENQTKKITP
ncbi:vesicular glutamate transporter 3-like [Planococcus citri]|uniref:vesicular glutamate transporter 3-like n=1 Tax=Planococcus citri TaxID=170843 RepID=UPI0031F94470